MTRASATAERQQSGGVRQAPTRGEPAVADAGQGAPRLQPPRGTPPLPDMMCD